MHALRLGVQILQATGVLDPGVEALKVAGQLELRLAADGLVAGGSKGWWLAAEELDPNWDW